MGVRKRYRKWFVDFQFHRKRIRRASPDNSRKGALNYEIQLRKRLAGGEPLDPERVAKDQPKELMFREFASEWLETYVKSNNKHSEYVSKQSILNAHLVPFFGRKKLGSIGSRDVECYKAEKIAQKLKAKTINNQLTVLRRALQTAKEWGLIAACPEMKQLRKQPSKYDFLTREESQQLLDASSGRWHDMILMALETGLRFGELTALTWEDVDFTTGELTIRQAYARGVLGSTKSNRVRHIPMSESVRQLLTRRVKERGLVFPGYNGEYLRQNRSMRTLKKICEKAGIRAIGWHTLRHTFASHLVQRGANLLAVQALLGHTDIQTTMRYAHLNSTALHEAMQVLSPRSSGGKKNVTIVSQVGGKDLKPMVWPKESRTEIPLR